GEGLGGVSVAGGVVGLAGVPAGPDDAQPGAGEDADGVWVAAAAGAGAVVDVGGPGAAVAGVVGEGGERLAGAGVAGVAEADGAVGAGGFGHRCRAELGGGVLDRRGAF